MTDHEILYQEISRIIKQNQYSEETYDIRFSESNIAFKEKYGEDNNDFKPLNVNKNIGEILEKYKLIISLHCKQIFSRQVVENIRCVNVHPGFNPYNRGWYPHVFSIINGMQAGVTIHEMNEMLDSGPVILREEILIDKWETSEDIYKKILDLEIHLLQKNLKCIIDESYVATPLEKTGNLNTKKDFEELCSLNLNRETTLGESIDILRALTHGDFNNAYFCGEDGKKIYVKIQLEKEK